MKTPRDFVEAGKWTRPRSVPLYDSARIPVEAIVTYECLYPWRVKTKTIVNVSLIPLQKGRELVRMKRPVLTDADHGSFSRE